MSRYLTKTNLILAAIILLAAFLRFYRLDQLPPGFQFDQAFYVLDALKLVQGEFAIFFYQPGRSEPLYQYLLMPFVALVGADSPLGLKITSAIISILTIPLVYGITRALFRSTRVALLAALFTTISFWHIFYARYGERIPLTLLMAILTFWFLWRALVPLPSPSAVNPGKRWRMFAFTGVFTGVTLYTYPAGRIVPIAIVLLIAYAILTDRAHARDYLKGLALAATIAFLVFLPLGIYYLQHPIDFISHAAEVSIFVPHGAVSDNLPLELSKNALKILGMFFIVGDSGGLRNLPYRPVFDPLVGALFVIGVIVWAIQLISPKSTPIERSRAMFLVVWLGLAVALSLISDDAPNNGRILIGLPVVMILPAWGAVELIRRWRASVVAVLLVAIVSTTITFRDYFIVWANDPGTYYAFDADKVEIADWLNRNAPTNQIFLAPLLAQNGTITLLTRNAPLKSFDSRDTIILPSTTAGKDALYVFPWEQEKRVQTMTTRLGALGERQDLHGSNGGKLVLIYRVPVQNLPNVESPISFLSRGGDFTQPQKIVRAGWSDSIELLGYTIDAADNAKRNLEVTVFFHALAPMPDDYTFSVKVRDAQDRVWGQEDKWAGNNSYATTQWSPGDVIVEKFYPGLNACAPAGEYRITVEAYDPKSSHVLGEAISLGATRADASPGNLYEHLEPAQTIDVQTAPQARLLGYTLTPNDVQVGDTFSLALFWRGIGDGKQARNAIVKLRDASGREFALVEKTVTLSIEGRGLCTFFDFQMPQVAAPGQGLILVNDTKLSTLNVVR